MVAKEKNRLERVLISAGGTGGHIFPGLALADAFQKAGVGVSWLGSKRQLDQELIVGKLPFHALPMEGWRGRGVMGRIRTLLTLIRSCWKAWRYIKCFSPDVVVTFGGYVTVPVGLMAWLLRIPLVIHEQNSVPGSANRLLARLAKKTMTAFPKVLANSTVCGNPLRKEFEGVVKEHKQFKGQCHVLVLGGSLGASAINDVVLEFASNWNNKEVSLSIKHQTGESDYKRMEGAYGALETLSNVVSVKPFIDNMLESMLQADLIIARSGALTVSEIAAVGVASILVPYPKAIDDHQFKNAMLLADSGAAIVVREERLTVEYLTSIVTALVQESGRCEAMGKAALSVHRANAVTTIMQACEEVA